MHKSLYTTQYQALLTQLRELRQAQGVTQSELAERLAWTQVNVSKVETGVRRLDVIELKLWVEALGSDLPSFVDRL
ncbi:MAG: helix-turn-helix transcriptional regulator [Ottowia sp.]|uniref:helix-turn-helix domain-containing protein n=1 Tax=Ottowia sp. TaxID=1898956 RepID=UPI0039E45542